MLIFPFWLVYSTWVHIIFHWKLCRCPVTLMKGQSSTEQKWKYLVYLPDRRGEDAAWWTQKGSWNGASSSEGGDGTGAAGDDESARWETSPGELPQPHAGSLPEAGSRAEPAAEGERSGPGAALTGQRQTAASILPTPTTWENYADVINSFQQVNGACCHIKCIGWAEHICLGFLFQMGYGEQF